MTIQTSIYAYTSVKTPRPRLEAQPAPLPRPRLSMAEEAAAIRERARKAWGLYSTGDGFTENGINGANTARQQQSQAMIAETADKVLALIHANGPAGTDALAKAIGGKPWYVEKAVTRLRRAGKIRSKRTGMFCVWVAV